MQFALVALCCGVLLCLSVIQSGEGADLETTSASERASEESGASVRRRLRNGRNGLNLDKAREHHHHHNSSNIFVLPESSKIEELEDKNWDIPMPSKSYFAGFDAPDDALKWNQAQLKASRGEQTLLAEVMKKIRSPFDLFGTTNDFQWVHKITDLHMGKENDYFKELESVHVQSKRAPIVMLGHFVFEHQGHEGPIKKLHTANPGDILGAKRSKNSYALPSRKIVAVGMFNENWGWGSTYFLNRTVPWSMGFGQIQNPFDQNYEYPDQALKDILDDENIVALVLNGHHNISHPKVISVPLGLQQGSLRDMWAAMQKAARSGAKKENLMFTAGSNYAFRPAIRECIAKNMKEHLTDNKKKISVSEFRKHLIASYSSLAMPGLGADTYRLWETLASGTMPVLEKGMGLDRTLYRLPALLVEDYAEVTPYLLRQAYIEALYRADQWEYERMTKQYWERLIYEISESNSLDPLLKAHPLNQHDQNFTRPLVPFDCEAIGGCGSGTKRVPKKSCAIDFSIVDEKYNWHWKHE